MWISGCGWCTQSPKKERNISRQKACKYVESCEKMWDNVLRVMQSADHMGRSGNEGVSFTYNTMVTASKQGGSSRINRSCRRYFKSSVVMGKAALKNRLKSKSRFSQTNISSANQDNFYYFRLTYLKTRMEIKYTVYGGRAHSEAFDGWMAKIRIISKKFWLHKSYYLDFLEEMRYYFSAVKIIST